MTKTNYVLIIALTISATLGGLLFGYDTAVISGAVEAINYNFIDPRHLGEGIRNVLSGFVIGCALLGCVIGAVLAGPISTGIGRRSGLLIAGILFFVSSIGAGFPELGWSALGASGVNALPFFVGYRLMGGVAIGMASMLAPMYIAEVAPPKQRGMLVTMQQIAIVLGINLVYVVNWLIQSMGSHDFLMERGWRYMLASAAVPALLLIICMLLVPETPRYLVLKDRDGEALKILKRLMGDGVADQTLKEIKTTLVQHTRPLFSFGAALVFVGIVLSAFQQLVGINAVLYYAPTMFENMGSSTNSAFLQTVIVGATNSVFTLVALVTVDKLGRKPLLVMGALVMAGAMLTLGTLFDMHLVSTTVQHGGSTASSLMGIGAVIAYIAGFSFSWGPVTWVLLSEIFPNSIKGKAMAIAVAAQWITNFAVSASFPMMDRNSILNAAFNHGFAYWLYGAFAVLSALFVLRFVPETKGLSLEAIEQLWRAKPRAAKQHIREK